RRARQARAEPATQRIGRRPHGAVRGPRLRGLTVAALITPQHNPLRAPSDRRLNRIAGPSALIVFGVTGDLSRKKLMPAVYDLANRGPLPPGFGLVGFARRDWQDEDFEKVVYESIQQYARTEFREEVWRQLARGIRFVSGEFHDDAAFERLKVTVEDLD